MFLARGWTGRWEPFPRRCAGPIGGRIGAGLARIFSSGWARVARHHKPLLNKSLLLAESSGLPCVFYVAKRRASARVASAFARSKNKAKNGTQQPGFLGRGERCFRRPKPGRFGNHLINYKMNLTKFKRWDGKWFTTHTTADTSYGAGGFFSSLEPLRKITEVDLLNLGFRRDYRIMLSSSCFDQNGTELFEGDIVRMHLPSFDSINERIFGDNAEGIYGYVDYFPTLKKCALSNDIGRSLTTLEENNSRLEIVGSLYENPEWINKFGVVGLRERYQKTAG